MAVTARRKPAPAAASCGHQDLAEFATVVGRVVTRLIVQVSRGPYAATFREIATQELRVASTAEADVIEKFLGEHP
jgi:hypothetical protein